ncbi:replication protein P [Vibrio ostreicida]|uniref:Replication protein P n=1 Tax=Vibrio ostreicida TaxID=526588 RepID=A0ABT8BXF8_9VIBR|nr:replication protein P [Vibrio ostreicida]MDN3611338.1 replication protein P [Vibrio ostreicida]NPD09275.1 hypothetical protein [Vibrio ostreicida]
MKSIAELTHTLQPGVKGGEAGASSSSPSRPVPQAAIHLVNDLFAELQGIFPAWRVAFPNQTTVDKAKRTWTLALFESGVHHRKQIEFGLRKARLSGLPYIPSVGQFVQWCRPSAEDLNQPTVRQAFAMLGDYQASQQLADDTLRATVPLVVQAAFNQINHWDLGHLSEGRLFPIFEDEYQRLLTKLACGEDISAQYPRALPTPSQRTLTFEEKERHRVNGLSIIQQLKRQHFGRNPHDK